MHEALAVSDDRAGVLARFVEEIDPADAEALAAALREVTDGPDARGGASGHGAQGGGSDGGSGGGSDGGSDGGSTAARTAAPTATRRRPDGTAP